MNAVTNTATCIQTCGNLIHESWEACDDGNNESGDGCAEGCLSTEANFNCTQTGPCQGFCGNAKFEGAYPELGIPGT